MSLCMKKGFTLIDLLAVIIILAILMIIAVPNILSTLATARSSAFITQAESVYKAAEQQYIIDTMSGNASTCYDKTNLNLGSISSGVTFTVQMNSSNGTVSNLTITDSGQQLTASGTTMNNIALTTYNSSTLSCSGSNSNNQQQQQQSTFGGTLVAAITGQTHKGIVYLDPKDLTATCTSESTLTTTNTGCKKFYIFDDSGTTYKMIMWKNTTATVAWNSTCTSSTSPTCGTMNEVSDSLTTDTAGWSGSPRLITADEIADIVDNGTWSSSTSTTYFYFGSLSKTNYSKQSNEQKAVQESYHWLFDYTQSCTTYGCVHADSSTSGYWTSTPVSGYSNYVWLVYIDGGLTYGSANDASTFGVRPVIEISKSSIS